MRDIVVTWPKKRLLADYLETLVWAERNGRVINFRVARVPRWDDAVDSHGFQGWPFGVELPRCYRVHDGAVRGFTEVRGTCHRQDGEVEFIGGEGYWPAGTYIVCSPEWHSIAPIPMCGFRGWRWFEEAPRRSLLAEQRAEVLT